MLRTHDNVPKLRESGRNDLVHWPNYNIISPKGIRGINDDKVSEESEDNSGREILQEVALNGNDFHAINFSEDFKIKYGFWKILFLVFIILILVIAFVCCYRYAFLKLRSVYQRISKKSCTESLSKQEQNLLESWIVAKNDSLHEDFELLINEEKEKLLCKKDDVFEYKNEYKPKFVKDLSSSHSSLTVLNNQGQEYFVHSDGDRIQIVMKDLATNLISETQEKESLSDRNSMEIQETDNKVINEYEDYKSEVEKVSINDGTINLASNKKIQLFDIPTTYDKTKLLRSLSASDINRICITTRKYSDPGLQLIDATEPSCKKTCNYSKELQSLKINENIGVDKELYELPKTQQLLFKHEGAGESLNDSELTKTYDNLSMLISHHMKQQIRPCQRKYCLLGRHLRKKAHHDERKCLLRYTYYENYLGDQAADCHNSNICEDTYDEFEMMRVAPDQRKQLNRVIHERRRRFLN